MVETKWQRESHFGDLLESRVCMQLIGNGFAGTDEVFGKQHVARALRFLGARCALIYVGVVFRFLYRGGGICGDNHETLRDTSRGFRGVLSRSLPNAWICRAWDWAKSGVSSSCGKTTLLVSRFMPCTPAQTAESMLPAPYQRRSRRPGECGSTRLENSSTTPRFPENSRTGSPATSRLNNSTRALLK